jgi:hypothetical protein
MTTALRLNSTLEQMQGGKTVGFSPAPDTLLGKVNTVLEKVRTAIDFPKRSQALISQFNAISLRPAFDKVKEFFEITKQQMTAITAPAKQAETSIELEEFSQPTVGEFEQASSILSTSEIAKNVDLATPVKEAIKKADGIFTNFKEKVDKLETPLEAAEIGLEWAALVDVLHEYAEVASEVLGKATAPLKLVSLVAKMKKVHKAFFAAPVEGAEPIKPSAIVSMGFSLLASVCSVLSWLQKIGIITPAIALAGRLTLIGGLCNIMVALVDLVDNVKNYTTATKLIKALLNLAVAVITVVLIGYVIAHLQLLLLMLGTGILILNVAVPDKDDKEEVKEVQ